MKCPRCNGDGIDPDVKKRVEKEGQTIFTVAVHGPQPNICKECGGTGQKINPSSEAHDKSEGNARA